MKYPDYVKQYRPKGTVVKKTNRTYYAYYATSKRVPGKSYPVQELKGVAGTIDEYGFHPAEKVTVPIDQVVIRECGFTNYLLLFEDGYIAGSKHPKADARSIYRSMIVYLSNNSYLCDDPETTIYRITELVEKFSIGIPNQVTAISKLIECDLKQLEPLKYICCVRLGKTRLESTLSKAQEQILKELGIEKGQVYNGQYR